MLRTIENQIVTLSVDGYMNYENCQIGFQRGLLFSQILNIFTNVRRLKFYQSIHRTNAHVRFNDTTLNFSSNLVELHIHVQSFDDCLCLLDGRLSQLSRCFLNIHRILPIRSVNGTRVRCEGIEMFFSRRIDFS